MESVEGSVTRYSVYTVDGSLVQIAEPSNGSYTDYVRAGGIEIARVDQSGTASYVHSDRLGSPVAGTSTSGAVLWREDYTPFGESRQNPSSEQGQENFTGHIRDHDSGLIYMQARYMDPVIGRFYSNDPVALHDGGVDYFNRYAYTNNDPVNMIDPDGRMPSQRGNNNKAIDPTQRANLESELQTLNEKSPKSEGDRKRIKKIEGVLNTDDKARQRRQSRHSRKGGKAPRLRVGFGIILFFIIEYFEDRADRAIAAEMDGICKEVKCIEVDDLERPLKPEVTVEELPRLRDAKSVALRGTKRAEDETKDRK